LIETFRDTAAAALSHEGLWLLVIAVILAGLVRGFSGFGTTMIYMPFAASVLPPVWALVTILVFDVFGPLPNIPRALREGEPRDVGRLGLGALLALPVGVLLLTRIDPVAFRWAVSVIALVLLGLLVQGWRWKGRAGRALLVGTGAVAGLLGGFAGLSGPPVIMLYMSSGRAVSVIRANILLFLALTDLIGLAVVGAKGLLAPEPVVIGLLLTLPYLLANMAGAAIFAPQRAGLYRAVAYLLIALSSLLNLPLFS